MIDGKILELSFAPQTPYLIPYSYLIIKDRNWVSIYEESERLLYEEINYINEADNSERFAKDFKGKSWVRVPDVYRELSTPRVLTMEFVESLKLTDIKRIEELKLDKKLLAKRTAESFLRQIVETGYVSKVIVFNLISTTISSFPFVICLILS